MESIIILIMWCACSLLIMIQYAPCCKEINEADKLLVGLIFIIGGPFFLIVNILEELLDMILPEGWDQQDGL